MPDPYSDPMAVCPSCGTTTLISPDECEWGLRVVTFTHTCPCSHSYVKRWLRDHPGDVQPIRDVSASPRVRRT